MPGSGARHCALACSPREEQAGVTGGSARPVVRDRGRGVAGGLVSRAPRCIRRLAAAGRVRCRGRAGHERLADLRARRRRVAGAFSMGTGEYISVTNQNELVQSEVSLERQMLSQFPAAEQEELAGYFRQYGADPDTAARM